MGSIGDKVGVEVEVAIDILYVEMAAVVQGGENGTDRGQSFAVDGSRVG